jgi:hypothetical protein
MRGLRLRAIRQSSLIYRTEVDESDTNPRTKLSGSPVIRGRAATNSWTRYFASRADSAEEAIRWRDPDFLQGSTATWLVWPDGMSLPRPPEVAKCALSPFVEGLPAQHAYSLRS